MGSVCVSTCMCVWDEIGGEEGVEGGGGGGDNAQVLCGASYCIATDFFWGLDPPGCITNYWLFNTIK